MARPKKAAPNHGEYFVKAITLGRDKGGKLIRKYVYSKKSLEDAQLKALRFKEAYSRGTLGNEPERITFRRYAEMWLESEKRHYVSESTFEYTYRNSLENHLIPEFGDCLMSRIQKIDINNFLNRKVGLSQSLIHKLLITLKQIFEDAVDNDIIAKNPCKRVKEPISEQESKIIVPYTAEQEAVVMEFAKTHPLGLSIIILLKAGLRRSELLGLRWEDLDFENNVIYVRRAVTETNGVLKIGKTKTRTSLRTVPMTPELKGALQKTPRSTMRYIHLRDANGRITPKRVRQPVPNRYVISNIKGEAIRPSNWQSDVYFAFMSDLATAHPEVPLLRPHGLRHTYGTRLYNNGHGIDIYTVSRLMGHADISITTKIYVKHDQDYIEKAFQEDL
jgi:integrase